MAMKTKFSKDDFIEILLNYDFGKYKNSKLFTTGTVQTNLLLQTNKKNLDADIILDKTKVVKLKELLPYYDWWQKVE